MPQPPVIILQATGTNRDQDAAEAVRLAGGLPTVLHVNQLRKNPSRLLDYQMLILPGGFSYGDALGAGRLLAQDLRWLFQDPMARFIESGKPVIGICNGFQALVKSRWLPGLAGNGAQATLTRNTSNRFECRWVWLAANPQSQCVFTKGITDLVHCPVAHGEGRFVTRDAQVLTDLHAQGRITLTYSNRDGSPPAYPANPNGSVANIAGICNAQGNVMGMMPHPENHIYPWQHPRRTRGEYGNAGLKLFENGIRYAAGI
ncbi:MAG: phosphoribosylformylglycinamidine synthase I [Anaerolineae bacterium]|nr:phosphoribosylformylglycinamidine synthase I [Anaerolineae bacterium]